MKKFLPFVSFLLVAACSLGQTTISRFTWDAAPLTKADVGPDALSVSGLATSSTGGVSGTNGLNPGTSNVNIDLVLPGSYFNLPAIDISVDFRREESQASFFYRGSYFDFGMNGGKLGVTFMVKPGESATTINSGNIYNIPDDHSFHHYRFSYDNNLGTGKVWVDGVVVYTYTGTAGAPLYWTGAGNITIGKDMDATGRNITVLDNLVVQNPSAGAALPLELLSFNAEAKNNTGVITWSTAKEMNVAGFQLERSFNATDFITIKNITATNNFNLTNYYRSIDSTPSKSLVYYRLKMIDVDGKVTYSPVKAVNFGTTENKTQISCYPNPTTDYINIRVNNNMPGEYRYNIVSMSGQVISSNTVSLAAGSQEIKVDLTKTGLKGIMMVQLINKQSNSSESFKIVRN